MDSFDTYITIDTYRQKYFISRGIKLQGNKIREVDLMRMAPNLSKEVLYRVILGSTELSKNATDMLKLYVYSYL